MTTEITEQETIDRYYTALVNKDPDFLGVFFVGVKTTGVFCIATCNARKPKKENVVFYRHVKDALENGYRPCKLCKPTENAYEAPEYVMRAMTLVRQHPKQKLTDYALEEHELSPSQLRRWFQKHYGMTFQAFARMYRINQAFIELSKGKQATQTAFDTGYDSLSGFGYTYKKLLGASPQQTNQTTGDKTQVILISRLTTPIGPMFVCATDTGVCLLEFTNRKMLETEFKDLQKRCHARILIGENEHIVQAKRELDEYFAGARQVFDVSLDPVGTDFQKQVWSALQEIGYGETVSYLQQATAMNRPKAVRAVASANGYNKIAIIIPCHRVIGSNGKLTGYGGGLERKKWLLAHEAKPFSQKA